MENNSKVPTPGPWRYDDLGGYIWATEDRMVGQVRGFGASLPQNANGRLLATAPDLLAAAKLGLACLDEDDFPHACNGIKNAISKAEGK